MQWTVVETFVTKYILYVYNIWEIQFHGVQHLHKIPRREGEYIFVDDNTMPENAEINIYSRKAFLIFQDASPAAPYAASVYYKKNEHPKQTNKRRIQIPLYIQHGTYGRLWYFAIPVNTGRMYLAVHVGIFVTRFDICLHRHDSPLHSVITRVLRR